MLPIISWVPSIAPGDIIFYSGDEFLGWDQNLLVTSLKYKLLVKLEMHQGNIVNKQIIFKDKIGRLRDIEVNSSGEIYLITDEKKSSIWRLTSAQNNR
jgi:quinoprotein glucose dehydrogenase